MEMKGTEMGGAPMPVEIAVIDGGIREDLSGIEVIERVDFSGVRRGERGETKGTWHGSVCARIIRNMCPPARFYDLAITRGMDPAPIDRLTDALEWCCARRVRLINLSMGTVNYHDFDRLFKTVERLGKAGCILTAAYHNENVRTAPALFPGVFGVRRDLSGELGDGEYYFQRTEGYREENTLVARMDRIWLSGGKYVRAGDSNSFAAPVVTGVLGRFLEKNPGGSFEEAKRYLEANQRKVVGSGKRPETLLPQGRKEIESVVIAAHENLGEQIYPLLEKLREVSSPVEVVSGIGACGNAIPFSWFRTDNLITERLLQNMDRIYSPNSVLFLLRERDFQRNRENPLIDFWVSFSDGRVAVTGGINGRNFRTE